ncbi:glycosyltransferase family 4 protein [Staphylococcus hsinchuensis]|uniref:Glycosyltransferase family 4 protein n=1 Tax=Staphylococcus hsinchuensis TaxID=3051183 RepID=A0ABZ3EFQ9_9STAP
MKKVWILNHYATDNYFNEGGRHYWFSQNLKNNGYDVSIFCANTRHNSKDVISLNGGKYIRKIKNDIPFIFVKSSLYEKNNYKRIINILTFSKNLLNLSNEFVSKYGKPDIIVASSVHPLTLMVGLRIAKKLNIPCIVEIRDLWPESIVAYGILSEKNILSKLMYKCEKIIYQKADAIIMTWEGGKDYIKNKGWFNKINKNKIYHISNGVVLSDFDYNSQNFFVNKNLEYDIKAFVYTGSIRKVNNIEVLVEAADLIQNKYKKSDIKILIYGNGDKREYLIDKVQKLGLTNIEFKGSVPKKYIPSILKQSYANILHNKSTQLNKYGQSQNKLFEYLAAGKPILQTYQTGYSVIDRFNAGVCLDKQTPDMIANAIIEMSNNERKSFEQGENARSAAHEFDFEKLTSKLIKVIENEEV